MQGMADMEGMTDMQDIRDMPFCWQHSIYHMPLITFYIQYKNRQTSRFYAMLNVGCVYLFMSFM